MRRLPWLLVVAVLGVVPAWAQYPEVDALLEAFFAKDLATVARHLPPSLEKSLSELPPTDRASIEQELLIAEKMKRERLRAVRGNGGEVLLTVNNPSEPSDQPVEISLEKRLSDGSESVLRLKVHGEEQPGKPDEAFTLWMRFVEGEWRLYEAQFPSGEKINLDDPGLLDRVSNSRLHANEASALGGLRTLNVAAVTYASTYPDVGFPPSLEVLGGDDEGEPSSTRSKLVAASLTTAPYEKSGYRFSYRPGGGSPIAAYTIVVRPIDFGTTGKRSFFADESGVIRYTDEAREPTVQDKPLQ